MFIRVCGGRKKSEKFVSTNSNGVVVPGKTVVFSINQDSQCTGKGLEVKGQNVQTTDANGCASFVVGLDKDHTAKSSTDSSRVASTKYTAKVLGVTDNTNSEATGSIGFAALSLSKISNNVDANKDKLTPAKNAQGKVDSVAKTYSLNNESTDLADRDVDYIATQQVSSEGKDEHEVTFNTKPQIVLPSMVTEDNKADEFVKPVNIKSGDYFTYANFEKIITLDEDASKLAYATLMFNDITLSNYSQLIIKSYTTEKCEDKDYIANSEKVIKGPHTQKGFGYQLPLSSNVKAVKVIIKSAGQVETDQNAGFDIDKIVGVYKKATATVGKPVDISSAKITWENVDPTMSEWADLKYEDATLKLGIAPKNATGDTFKYQLPVFPYTGDAVIKETDKNGKIVGYYLAPTIKSNNKSDKTANTNILDVNSVKAYEVTAEEALTRKVGSFKSDADGNNLKVNSEKVGSTNLKGTISLPSLGSDVLDASNKYVYTSVQWNPIPNTDATSDAFVALAGQNINVYAQLVDKNGNPVSAKDETISYVCKDSKNGNNQLVSADDTKKNGDVAVIKNTKTDINGKATLTLNSAQADVITGLSAKTTGYNVRLYIGEGKANLMAKLNLNISWESKGIKSAFVSPAGTTISRNENEVSDTTNGTVDLFVKVTDETGLNPVKGKEVTFTSNNTDIDTFTSTNKDITDANGIAKVTLNTKSMSGTAVKSSIITATIKDSDQVATTTINWTKYDKAFGLVNANVVDGNSKQIELTFNENVQLNSLKKELFEVKDSEGNPCEVVDVKADGKYVKLTLSKELTKSVYTVTVKDNKEIDGVTYNLVSDKGVKIAKTELKSAKFYSDMAGKFDAKVDKDGDDASNGIAEITVGGIVAENTLDESFDKFANNFRVVVDGVIQEFAASDNSLPVGSVYVNTTATSGKMSEATYTIKLNQKAIDQKVSIYFAGGVSKPLTVAAPTNAETTGKLAGLVTAANTAIKTDADANDTSIIAVISNGDTILNLSRGSSAVITEIEDADDLISVDNSTNNKITVKAISANNNKDRVARFNVTYSKNFGKTVVKKYELKIAKGATDCKVINVDDTAITEGVAKLLTENNGKKITDLFKDANGAPVESISKKTLEDLAANETTIDVTVSSDNSVLAGTDLITIDKSKNATDTITLKIKKNNTYKNVTIKVKATGTAYTVTVE